MDPNNALIPYSVANTGGENRGYQLRNQNELTYYYSGQPKTFEDILALIVQNTNNLGECARVCNENAGALRWLYQASDYEFAIVKNRISEEASNNRDQWALLNTELKNKFEKVDGDAQLTSQQLELLTQRVVALHMDHTRHGNAVNNAMQSTVTVMKEKFDRAELEQAQQKHSFDEKINELRANIKDRATYEQIEDWVQTFVKKNKELLESQMNDKQVETRNLLREMDEKIEKSKKIKDQINALSINVGDVDDKLRGYIKERENEVSNLRNEILHVSKRFSQDS